MTYENIADWVKNNYDLGAYFSPEELIREVKKQFEYDGGYYPNEAGKYIRDVWVDQYRTPDRALDFDSNQRETLEDVRNDYRNRFSNFFEEQNPEIQYVQTYETQQPEETLATPPPVVEQLPEEPRPERRSWYAGGFKDLASRIWGRLRGI